jgi:hypothetical protein
MCVLRKSGLLHWVDMLLMIVWVHQPSAFIYYGTTSIISTIRVMVERMVGRILLVYSLLHQQVTSKCSKPTCGRSLPNGMHQSQLVLMTSLQ